MTNKNKVRIFKLIKTKQKPAVKTRNPFSFIRNLFSTPTSKCLKSRADIAYLKGIECIKKLKYQEASDQFRLAAEDGHARAKFNMGVLYALGMGLEQNDVKALKWIEQSALAFTCPEAHDCLYEMYKDGILVEANLKDAQAHKHYANSIRRIALEGQ